MDDRELTEKELKEAIKRLEALLDSGQITYSQAERLSQLRYQLKSIDRVRYRN